MGIQAIRRAICGSVRILRCLKTSATDRALQVSNPITEHYPTASVFAEDLFEDSKKAALLLIFVIVLFLV
jgi:hypothetical protein